jgi:competence CoiA-like predicted nuclease
MLLALNEQNELVQPDETGQRAICPHCKELVNSRAGEYKVNHWAHQKKSNCVTYNKEGKTEWHYDHQEFFKKKGYEIEKPITLNGKTKIADVMVNDDFAIEFQHSSISHDEIKNRESHYGKVIWVFDAIEAFKKDRLQLYDDKYSWKYPKETILSCYQPVFLHIGFDRYIHILSIKKERIYLQEWHTRTTLYYDGDCKMYNQFEFHQLVKKVQVYYKGKYRFPRNFNELPDNLQTSLF